MVAHSRRSKRMANDIKELKLADLTIDQEVNIRERLDKGTVQTYMDVFASLPPIVVFTEGKGKDKVLTVADGFHRCEAARKLKLETIKAEIRTGGREGALEFAALANLSHGRNLTLAERDQAIARLYATKDSKGKRKFTQRALATQLGMSQQTILLALKAAQGEKVTGAQVASRGDLSIVSGLPETQAKALLDLKEGQQWSRDELTAAVRTLGDDEVEEQYKADMLAGKSPPLSEGNEVAVATITRIVNTSGTDNPLRPLWRAMEGVSVMRAAHDPDSVAKAVTSYNLAVLPLLQEDITFMQDVAAALAVAQPEAEAEAVEAEEGGE
jgi:hypothetical protein